MLKGKFASVFGGAINDTTTPEYIDAVKIGEILGRNKYIVVNGGYRGIMEAVSKGANKESTAIGYTCKTFPSIEGNEYLTTCIAADDIYDRLRYLIEGVDVYIACRGGIGTLSEVFTVLDVIRKLKNPPKLILVGDHWRPIYRAVEGMMREKELALITIISDSTRLEELLR